MVHLLWIIGDGALFFFLLMNWQAMCTPDEDGLCEPRNWWYNLSIQVRPQRRHSCRPPPPSSSTTASAQPKPPSEVPRSAPQHTPVLHACVVQVVADFGGVVPTTVDELMSPALPVRKESARPVPWRGGGSQGREVVQGLLRG